MKNYEKYADKIREDADNDICCNFIRPRILKTDSCSDTSCSRCQMLQTLWLLEDYEEPEVDWSKVEVDTPILVRDNEDEKWLKRHFAKYENGRVYVWTLERTSWTTLDDKCVMDWNYAKLAEDKKKPEVDWSKIEVDTPVLVKNKENNEWKKRHFAKYENGDVYTWDNGHTSNESSCMVYYKYAKLVESEGSE